MRLRLTHSPSLRFKNPIPFLISIKVSSFVYTNPDSITYLKKSAKASVIVCSVICRYLKSIVDFAVTIEIQPPVIAQITDHMPEIWKTTDWRYAELFYPTSRHHTDFLEWRCDHPFPLASYILQ